MTRADLSPGAQAAQLAHAALDFAAAHPDLTAGWRRASNTIVLLAAADELSLTWLYADAVAAGRRAIRVHEPDLGGSLTAVALEPAAHRLVTHLPLALTSRRYARGGERS